MGLGRRAHSARRRLYPGPMPQKKRATAAAADGAKYTKAAKKAKTQKKRKPDPVTERAALVQPSALALGEGAFTVVSWNVDGLRAPGRVEGLKRLAAQAPI